MAASDTLVTELIVDAKLANAGAQEYERAMRRIEQASARATASVDRLGQSIDRAGQRMQAGGAAVGAAAGAPFDQHRSATAAPPAVEDFNTRYAQTIRLEQTGAFSAIEAASQYRALQGERDRIEGLQRSRVGRISFPEAGLGQSVAPFAVAAGTVNSTDQVAQQVGLELDSLQNNSHLSRAVRAIAQTESKDPTTRQYMAEAHAAEPIIAPAVGGLAPGLAGGVAQEAAMMPVLARLAAALEHLEVAKAEQAAAAATISASSAVPAITSAPAATAAAAAAAPQAGPPGGGPPGGGGPPPPPIITTNPITEAERDSLNRIAGAEVQAENADNLAAAAAAHHAATAGQRQSIESFENGPTGINVPEWLKGRQSPAPVNDVNVEEWNKLREANASASSSTNSLWTSFKNLFVTAKSGASDIHGATAAVDGLAGAHGHATGSAGRWREALVLVHEFLRGDWKRAVGSAMIELNNFGATKLLFNPITLGLGATIGAMAVLIHRAAEVEANVRSFTASLNVMGTSGQASGAGLQHIVDDLHHLGLSAADAKKAVDVVARTPGLQPGSFGQITDIGLRASQFAGGEPAQRVEELTKAVRGGVEGLIEYGSAYNAFSGTEINTLRALDLAGQSQLAVSRALDDIDHHLPHTNELFSDFHNTVQKLKNSWDELLTAMSKSPIVDGTVNAITAVLKAAGSPTGVAAIAGSIEGAIALGLTSRTGLKLPARLALGGVAGGAIEGTAAATGSPTLNRALQGAEAGAIAGSLVPLPGATIVGAAGGAGFGALLPALQEQARREFSGEENGLIDANDALREASRQNTEALHGLTDKLETTTRGTVSEASTRTATDRGPPETPTGPVADRVVHALIQGESRFDEKAESHPANGGEHAIGLTQVKLSTAQEIQPGITREQLFEPSRNVPIGVEYLRRMTEEFKSIGAGITAYNIGPQAYRDVLAGTRSLKPENIQYRDQFLSRAGLTGHETAGEAGLGLGRAAVVEPTPTQSAQIDQRQVAADRQLRALQQPRGFQQNREVEAVQAQEKSEKDFKGLPDLQNAARRQAQGVYDATKAIEQQQDAEERQRAITHARDTAQAGKGGIEQELRARAEAEAYEEQLRKGGPGVAARTQDTLQLQAYQALGTGIEQLKKEEETRVHDEQEIAAASQISRSATIQATIATEAHAFALDALHRAGVSNVAGLRDQALELAKNKAANLASIEVSREGIEAGSELQRNRDRVQSLTLQRSVVGQGSIDTERQLSYLRTEQDIRQRFPNALPEVQNNVRSSSNAIADMNAALAEAQQHQHRINELFQTIAGTVENVLGASLRNALIRTPVEAGQHIKHYWDELRASLKSTLADVVSGITQAALIKPVTSAIAGGLGLGQVAQQIGGFATGGQTTVGGSGGTDSQLVQFMATPGERIVVLTPAQQAKTDKTGALPHFANGGEMLVGGDLSRGREDRFNGLDTIATLDAHEQLYPISETPDQAARAVREAIDPSLRNWRSTEELQPPRGFAFRPEQEYVPPTPDFAFSSLEASPLGGLGAVLAGIEDVISGGRLGRDIGEQSGQAYGQGLEDPNRLIAQLPHFAGGGEIDPSTGQVVYYNDAGQPFELPGDAGPVVKQNSLSESASENRQGSTDSGLFGSLVGVARAGLQTESSFLSTAAADKPLLGLDTGTGEITGRIPALADFLQQGLVGGAPADTLSAGARIGRATRTARGVPALEEAATSASSETGSIAGIGHNRPPENLDALLGQASAFPEKVAGPTGLTNPLPVPEGYQAELNRLVSRAPGVGQPKNEALQLAPGVYVGDVSFDQWLERTQSVLSPEDITSARKWYGEALPTYEQYFGKDLAPQMMGAWLTANQNATPSFAQLSALRVREQLLNATPEFSEQKRGGLPHDALVRYWQSILTPDGIATTGEGSGRKIYDFIDSALGKTTRTFYGDDPRAGAPAVADVHSLRDMGFVDEALGKWVAENYGETQAVKLKRDMSGGGPTATMYEAAAAKMRSFTDKLNTIGFDGGSWSPGELQAVGWTAMSKMLGRKAETSSAAIEANVRNLSYELDFGAGAPLHKTFPQWDSLNAETKAAVGKDVLPRIVDHARSITGALEYERVEGLGGWGPFTNPAFKSQLLASPEVAGDTADIIGYLAEQTKIFGYRAYASGNKIGVAVYGKDLANVDTVQKLWDDVRSSVPSLAAGFSPAIHDGQPGTHIILDKGGAGALKQVDQQLIPAVNAASDRLGITVDAKAFKAEEVSREHDWEKDPTGSGYLSRLSARYGPDIPARLDLFKREELVPAIRDSIDRNTGSTADGTIREVGRVGPAEQAPERLKPGDMPMAADISVGPPPLDQQSTPETPPLGGFFNAGIPGFAIGGSLTVGGSGGTDSQHVQFMATPGERVVVLTPAQAAYAEKTGGLPHFASGGMLDPGTGDVTYFGDPEGTGAAQVSEMMQPAMSAIGHGIANEAREFGQAGADVARGGLAKEADFLSAKAADEPLIGLNKETGELTGRLPALAEFAQASLAGAAPADSLSAGLRITDSYAPSVTRLRKLYEEGGYWKTLSGSGVPKDLAPEEFEALGVYQQSSFINRALRQEFQLDAAHIEFVAALDSALDRSSMLGAKKVYRGGIPDDVLPNAGGEFEDRGYLSTTNSRKIANQFAESAMGSRVEILVPKGSNAIDLTKIPFLNDPFHTSYAKEKEVLLPRGLTLKRSRVTEPSFGDALLTVSPNMPPGFAGGTMGGSGTPPGWIRVGERGPEWVLQPGGATVLPNGVQPSDVPDPLGRSFASGTIGSELSTGPVDTALRSVTAGLQGLSSVLGQTNPGLQALARTASQLGAFANIWRGGEGLLGLASDGNAAGGPGSGPAAKLAGGLNNSTLTMNVGSVASGGTLTGPAQGGTVNSSGNLMTVQGAVGNSATTPPEPTAAASSAVAQAVGSAVNAPASLQGGAPVFLLPGTNTPAIVPSGLPAPAEFSSAFPAPAATSTGNFLLNITGGTSDQVGPSAGIAPQGPAATSAQTAATTGAEQQSTTAPAAASTGLVNPSTISAAVGGLSLIDKLNNSLPGFLPSGLQSGGALSGVGDFLSNPFGLFATKVSGGAPLGGVAGAPFSQTVAGPGVTEVPGLFGTTATFGSFLAGAGAGFGAGSLLNTLVGGNPTGGTVGSAGGALAGSAVGATLLGPLGTLLGGLIGGSAGGLLGGLVGGPPSGQSAGAVVGTNGQINFQDTGGSAANIQASTQVAQQIGSFVQALSQLTNAQGQPVGNIASNVVVSSDNRQGIRVQGSGISGGGYDQNAANAVTQTELQIVHSLTNVSGTLQTVLANINDPTQLQNAVQFANIYDKLNVTSAELTASLSGNTNAIGPFSQALTQTDATFSQLTAQAQQFGVSTAPISAGLDAVTATINQDFKINVASALSTAIDGGNDFIASLIKIHQAYVQNVNDAQALATGIPTGVTSAAAAVSASVPAAAATAPATEGLSFADFQKYAHAQGFASGTAPGQGTPPGWILVGENGPEWMLQPGGATVLPNGVQPADVPDPTGRAFADGTNDISPLSVAAPAVSLGSAISQASGGPSLLGAAASAIGIPSSVTSSLGSILPIAGPIAGGVLSLALGGNPISAGLGTAGSLIGFALGGPIGGAIGGLLGLVGNLFGPKPSNNASGDLVDLSSGGITGFQSGGNKNADQAVQQISLGISRVSTAFQQATGGTISGSVNVQDGKRDGIKTSYSGPLGNINAKWGDVSSAIGQFALAIAHNLQGIDPALQADLAGINDPDQLIPTIENFTGKGIDLSAAPAADTSSSAPTDQAAPAASSPPDASTGAPPAAVSAPDGSNSAQGEQGMSYADFMRYARSLGFASGTAPGQGTPPGWILVGERGPEWLLQPGGATILPNGVQPPDALSPIGRSFADGTISGTPVAEINAAIAGTEAAQAGPVLAGLGVDQLNTVIQNLGSVAPEIVKMAQALIDSANALPDFITQGIQALTDPLDLAIEKEKAAGQERVSIAAQTGQDLVKVQQLTSANLVQAVIGNLSNTNALNSIVYPGNTKALEFLQAGPTLAQLSGQQLTALASKIGDIAPDLASLAQSFIATGTALPDTITQALEGITNPLKLALQQQAAQAQARTQIATVTGQDPAIVAALNTASITASIVQNISNPEALQALVAGGSPRGLAQLQAGPAIAGLGADQLAALLSAIGTASPQLTYMINALVESGRALPTALVQADEAITRAGVLAIEKAQALGFEQVQGAAATGQSVPAAQQLSADEVAQAIAQTTNTQIPINGLPDWVTQLEEAVANPLQLAIQKEQAAGAERVQIAETTGADLVRVQKENADSIAQIWYQATQSLTNLKNDLTTGSLSGLTAANQVPASLEQFNTVLGLVQSGNTNFISELATAGQNAVQAAQTAYGNGPQTASVREQIYKAISPFLVSATGYPANSAAAIAAGGTASASAGTTDLQANTTALQDLTTAITAATTGAGAVGGGGGGSASAGGGGSALSGAGGAVAPAQVSAATQTPASAVSAGFTPNLTPTEANLSTQYQALPSNLQSDFNTVFNADPSDFNYKSGPAQLQNAVNTAALLTGYNTLSAAGQTLYASGVSENPTDFNDTPAGIQDQLGLVQLVSSYEALPSAAQTQFVTTVQADPATYSASPVGVQNQLSLVRELAAAAAPPPATGSTTPSSASASLTTNPVTGQSFAGSGITAVTPNFPTFPSASTLSNALADAIAGNATSSDWTTINQAVQAGILTPANQPGYASVIEQAQQVAAGQAVTPGAGLSQALSDAVNGTPTTQEWALINQAVNSGVLSPVAQPQYATVIRQARQIASAQATSLSQQPNNVTAYNTVINGLPAFAAGSGSTPPGMIIVGEKGPEWYHGDNDNVPWRVVGANGPEVINQPGGATILPWPIKPMARFAEGTSDWQAGRYAWATGGGNSTDQVSKAIEKLRLDLLGEMQAGRKVSQAGQMIEDQNSKTTHELTRQIVRNVGPNIAAPARRAVG